MFAVPNFFQVIGQNVVLFFALVLQVVTYVLIAWLYHPTHVEVQTHFK